MEEEKQTMWTKFTRFVKECKRVFMITKKPTVFEFKTIVKVSGIGILLIGLIGFVILTVKQLLFN